MADITGMLQASAGATPAPSNAWDLAFATFEGVAPGASISGYESTPNDVKFSSDGTKMYVLGDTRDAVLQYNLSTPYEPSTASIPSKSVAAEEATPRGVEFKTDGTKMYIAGSAGNDISEYDLSTAWDVATASYVQNFSVSAQTTSLTSKVRFKDDGTKMYVLSETNDSVYQYSLSTAWNISTASYDSVSFSVASQEANPKGMFFGDSGTKMYIIGPASDTVFQYTLSSAWDLSTASYASLSFSITAQENSPNDVFFKSDGTIMYVVGDNGDDVNQYALSSAWDVSTASFTKTSSPTFNVWYGEGTPFGIYIKSDGTQLYVVGTTVDTVFQQSMSSAWDVATLRPGLYVNAQESAPNGLAFKSDGTKMYIVGTANDTVYQYSLATAWDVLTATYDSVSFSVATQETEPRGIAFKTDGTKMYIIGSSGDDVNEYALSGAWDVSTASFTTNFSVSSQTGAVPVKVEFKDDGTKMYVLSDTNDTVFQYSLSSAWDISTASYDSVSYAVGSLTTGETTCTGLAFADSGTKMYIVGQVTDRVWGFVLDTAWNLATTNAYFRSVAAQETTPRSVTFKPDGIEMYILGGGITVDQFSLSTGWSVQTASFLQSTGSLSAQTGSIAQKVQFKDDGTKMYVLSQTNNAIYQYSLSTAWDVSTVTYDSVSFSVSGQDTSTRGMFFGNSGTKLYTSGATGDDINEYTLSTAWDLSTASFVQNFSVASQDTDPAAVFIGNNGSTMYVVGGPTNTIYQYTLSTPWDISTASYANKNFSVVVYDDPLGIWFKDDGLSFYVVGITNDVVWQFTIS